MTHSVSLHAWKAGGSGETSSTLGGHGGDNDGGDSGVAPELPKVPKEEGKGHNLGCLSPGDQGDLALQGGQVCQLHPEDKDTALVARPQTRRLLLLTRLQIWGGGTP